APVRPRPPSVRAIAIAVSERPRRHMDARVDGRGRARRAEGPRTARPADSRRRGTRLRNRHAREPPAAREGRAAAERSTARARHVYRVLGPLPPRPGEEDAYGAD